MFIRAVEHKNKKNHRKYRTYKLVDSVRTERGIQETEHEEIMVLKTESSKVKGQSGEGSGQGKDRGQKSGKDRGRRAWRNMGMSRMPIVIEPLR